MASEIDAITKALQTSWSIETSYGGMATVDNPARGQCVVSSLVLQDYFGGDLQRVRVSGSDVDEKHYFNVLDDGTHIDATGMQYDGMDIAYIAAPINLEGHKSIREKVLDDDTRRRYDVLSKRVKEYLEVNNAKA